MGHQRRSNPRYLFSYQLSEASLPGRIATVNGQGKRSRQDLLTMPARHAIPVARLERYGYSNATHEPAPPGLPGRAQREPEESIKTAVRIGA